MWLDPSFLQIALRFRMTRKLSVFIFSLVASNFDYYINQIKHLLIRPWYMFELSLFLGTCSNIFFHISIWKSLLLDYCIAQSINNASLSGARTFGSFGSCQKNIREKQILILSNKKNYDRNHSFLNNILLLFL